MNRKWKTIVAAMMATVMLVAASVPALADSHDSTAVADTERGPRHRALAIDGPRHAEPEETFTITVSDRASGDAVKDAAVWALTREQAEALRAEVEAARANEDATAVEAAINNAVSGEGILLGTTNGTGMLKTSIAESGGYLLVTLKPEYRPGVRPIGIGMKPKVLAIDAPRHAEPEETFTITVSDRNSGDAVKDAVVWALTREQAEALRAEVEAARANEDPSAVETAINNAVNGGGILLGTTNGAGMLKTSIVEAGGYLLVTLKPEYRPGVRPIGIGVRPKPLAIDAPRRAEVDESVTITVSDRNSGDAVKDAAVWALTREQAEALKAEVDAATESGDRAIIEAALESTVKAHGILLGTTNGAGMLKTTFSEAGGYLLVTIKPGYLPGHRPINIVGSSSVDFTSTDTKIN